MHLANVTNLNGNYHATIVNESDRPIAMIVVHDGGFHVVYLPPFGETVDDRTELVNFIRDAVATGDI